MDPEDVDVFIATHTPEEIADQLRAAYLALRCCGVTLAAVSLPIAVASAASS